MPSAADGIVLGAPANHDLRLADRDDIALAEDDLADPLTVHAGAVRRAEVGQHEVAVAGVDPGVHPRHPRVLDRQLAVRRATDPHRAADRHLAREPPGLEDLERRLRGAWNRDLEDARS